MDVTEKKFSVTKLVAALLAGSLLRNPEYQRGEAWKELQKAAFVDSLFRGYPIPALFLYVVESPGLEETPVRKFEIVDGQQRLIALRDFHEGKFRLAQVGANSKLRLPKSVQLRPAPWAGKAYSELSDELKTRFDDSQILVFEIGFSALADEVRDLFIRLQSGTALTRQQIRDAWPGKLGPFIERIAGKLDRAPTVLLFSLADRRGGDRADDDERDEFVADRQFAVQLLKVFFARESDPSVYTSVTASELDSFYHEHTDWDSNGPTAARFIQTLEFVAQVLERLKQKQKRKKFPRIDVTTLMLYFQDLTRNPNAKVERGFLDAVADCFSKLPNEGRPSGGRSSSPGLLKRNYEWWRISSPDSRLIRLADQRLFNDAQKEEIWARDAGTCQICREAINSGECEYDHFPVPYRDGGPTEPSNGRLVHVRCHPRGRPVEDE